MEQPSKLPGTETNPHEHSLVSLPLVLEHRAEQSRVGKGGNIEIGFATQPIPTYLNQFGLQSS